MNNWILFLLLYIFLSCSLRPCSIFPLLTLIWNTSLTSLAAFCRCMYFVNFYFFYWSKSLNNIVKFSRYFFFLLNFWCSNFIDYYRNIILLETRATWLHIDSMVTLRSQQLFSLFCSLLLLHTNLSIEFLKARKSKCLK